MNQLTYNPQTHHPVIAPYFRTRAELRAWTRQQKESTND